MADGDAMALAPRFVGGFYKLKTMWDKGLRPYQIDAINSLWEFWRENPSGTPLIIAPTGSGKTKTIAAICRRVLAAKPHYKILIVSHRKEIISQNAKEIYDLLQIPVGIYSAGLGQKQIRQITCANIQSIYKKKVDAKLVLLDECHLISRNSSSMYQKFIQGFEGAKFVGLTATPMRMDQGSLVGEGSLFTDIAYDIHIGDLISQGFLSPLISKRTSETIDFSKVNKSGFDFKQEELEALMIPSALKHVQEIREKTKDRKHVLLFCSGIKHAAEIAKDLGLDADYVTGEMLPFERDRKLNAFSLGQIKYLCNCDVLTTGYNFPGIDCVVLLRATQSAALYIQAVGRGSRLAEGKTNCLVLDFGGNIDRHGPIDLIEVRTKNKGKASVKAAPSKTCEGCGAVVAIKTRICPDCGAEFPLSSMKLEEKPSEKPILQEPEIFEVQHSSIKLHHKDGKPPSLRFIFKGPYNQEVSEFLCFSHGGYAAEMAKRKWAFYGGKKPAPNSTDEAYKRYSELIKPGKLEVIKEGKYYRVRKILEIAKEIDVGANI